MITGNDQLNPNDQKSYFDLKSNSYEKAFFTPAGGAIKRRFDRMKTLIEQKSIIHGHILEIGTGSGIFTSHINHLTADLIFSGDISFQMLRKARIRGLKRVKLLQYNAERLPYKDSSFNTIITFASIHHIKNIDNFFSECYRVLKPNGLLYAMEPNPLFPMNFIMALFNKYERGMMFSWPYRYIKTASKHSFFCNEKKFGSFFPGKPEKLEGIYSKIEMYLEKIPVIRNFSIFVYYCFKKL